VAEQALDKLPVVSKYVGTSLFFGSALGFVPVFALFKLDFLDWNFVYRF
jgi:hypothetical protein